MNSNDNTGKTVFCHFSFRRPKGKDYGLFAVAFFYEYDGKKPIAQITKRQPLWKNHQFVTAIQSYKFALTYIYHWQSIMKLRGINTVMLVTDNSTLAGWIENPRKNKQYTKWMELAVEDYRNGGPKEIQLGVGLARVRDYEKSYKFCREECVVDDPIEYTTSASGKNAINIEQDGIEYRTINPIELAGMTNLDKPSIDDGIHEN